jgi:signal transduction histidine kinase
VLTGAGRERRLRAALATWLPGVEVTTLAPEVRDRPDVACVIVDGDDTGAPLAPVRRLRAAGFEGVLVVLAAEPSPADARELRQLGAHCCPPDQPFGQALAELLAAALAADGGSGEELDARDELNRTRRLIATGAIAADLYHALTNPLTALVAEAQLLELEPMPPDQSESVRRILELAQRVSDVVRQLQQQLPRLGDGEAM